ncbi:MAG: hypothetical protein QGF94_03520 [Candidatus Thalassarchaeaceae archaeon]|nr:hypothetical protein [Candidatus Thalassarchaeaceae archaeon]
MTPKASLSIQRGTLFARIWLTVIIGTQVFVAPILAFTITYILDVNWKTNTIHLRLELMPWIVSAAIMYGLISLFLGLIIGGYMPTRVANAGGWLPVLGLSRRLREADMVDRARLQLTASPYGRVIRVVHHEVKEKGRPLLEVHGGLQLLAAPVQIVLIMLPLLVLRFVPGHWLQEDSLLDLSLLVYLSGLVIGLRLFPFIAQKSVGIAAIARRILVDRTKLGWLFPVLLLWLIERLIVGVAFQGLGLDVVRWGQLANEQQFLEAILPVTVETPESSFLDLLVALSLLPMAIFTTMAVLGGGDQDPPQWLIGTHAKWEGDDEEEETVALPAPGEGIGEATGVDVHLTDEENEEEEESVSEPELPQSFEDKIVNLAENLGTLSNDDE